MQVINWRRKKNPERDYCPGMGIGSKDTLNNGHMTILNSEPRHGKQGSFMPHRS